MKFLLPTLLVATAILSYWLGVDNTKTTGHNYGRVSVANSEAAAIEAEMQAALLKPLKVPAGGVVSVNIKGEMPFENSSGHCMSVYPENTFKIRNGGGWAVYWISPKVNPQTPQYATIVSRPESQCP